jgi:prepilin-type N-terminal cleavage/methylation domain-containing protein
MVPASVQLRFRAGGVGFVSGMQRAGFTIIELLLTIAILGVISGISIPTYIQYQQTNDISLAAENVTEGINRACILSQLGEQDSGWGYSIVNGVLFKGASYASRDASFDELYPVFERVSVSGPAEIAFQKLTCTPSVAGIIFFQIGNNTTEVLVQSGGTIVRANDKLTICHKPLVQGGKTLSVSENAWPAHHAHGDILGACSA